MPEEKYGDPPTRLLVTGGNGFLGSAIASHATQLGVPVRVTDRQSAGTEPNLGYVPADVLRIETLLPIMQDVSCVIHAAGLAHVGNRPKNDALFEAVNTRGTANVAEASARAGVRHLVIVSSVSVYGGQARGLSETALCRPETAYAKSKLRAEECALSIGKSAGMQVTILRLATLYGERDPGNVARLVRNIDQGRFIWIGDGSNRKSLLYRTDAARACVLASRLQTTNACIFNVSAQPVTVRQIVENLALALGRKPPPVRIPGSFVLAVTSLGAKLARRNRPLRELHSMARKWLEEDYYDTRKFQRASGFRSEVPLSEGLRREVAWYREAIRNRAGRELQLLFLGRESRAARKSGKND